MNLHLADLSLGVAERWKGMNTLPESERRVWREKRERERDQKRKKERERERERDWLCESEQERDRYYTCT